MEQPLVRWFPEYPELDTPERRRVTLAHALAMTSGFEWNEEVPCNDPRNDEIRMTRDANPLRYALSLSRRFAHDPGSEFTCNGGLTETMTILTPERIYEEEMLDAGEGTDDDVARSLTDLRRINRFLGGRRVVLRALSMCLEGANLKEFSMLDVGTGSADVPMAVVESSRMRGLHAFVAAVDISERNLRIARSQLGVSSEIQLVQGDSMRLPFAERSFDFVTASLFLHHFRDDDVVRLLADFGRVASRAVIVNDLIRDRVPYYFTRIAGPLLAASFLTRNDGPVSVLRGFTTTEMKNLAQRAGLKVREIKRMLPYRLSMIGEVVSSQ